MYVAFSMVLSTFLTPFMQEGGPQLENHTDVIRERQENIWHMFLSTPWYTAQGVQSCEA